MVLLDEIMGCVGYVYTGEMAISQIFSFASSYRDVLADQPYGGAC